MLSPHRRFVLVGLRLAFLLLVAGLGGCSQSPGTISGKVTYQGKELKGGNVSFVSAENGPSFSAAIGEDGTYKAQNVRAGKYKLCVETASLKPPQGAINSGAGKKGPNIELSPGTKLPEGYTPSSPGEARAVENLKRYVPIPDSYSKPETTDLTCTVTGGDQTQNIELK